jgi:predicted  nucleic acid-binding Zn-ribbon protein
MPDICEHLRKEMQTHHAAITKLREELEVYVGTPDAQESDSEEIKAEIAEHRRAIEELRIGMESQKC